MRTVITDEVVAKSNLSRLAIVAGLVLPFSAVEFFFGLWSGALTLLADSLHMLFDFAALALSIVAMLVSRIAATERYSFGFHRAQVLAALVNALIIIILACWILVEAVNRVTNPIAVLPIPVLIVGSIGLALNVFAYSLLSKSANLNVRAAALHVLGDLLGSIAVLISAVVIWLTEWTYIDPTLATLVACILLRGSVIVLRDVVRILMQAAPQQFHYSELREAVIDAVDAVVDVLDIHVWSLTLDRNVASLQIVVSDGTDHVQASKDVRHALQNSLGLTEITVQVNSVGTTEPSSNQAAPTLDQSEEA